MLELKTDFFYFCWQAAVFSIKLELQKELRMEEVRPDISWLPSSMFIVY